MAYQVVPVSDFPGLDLVSSPDQAGCIDMLNVDLDVRGALRQRDGYDNFTSSAAADRYQYTFPYYETDGTKQLLCGRGSDLDAIDTAGATTNVVNNPVNASDWSMARMGTPTGERAYLALETPLAGAPITIYRYDGATATSVATTPLGALLAIQSPDNRLVAAKDISTTTRSKVSFSNAGNAEVFTSTDFVYLTPGDGEQIEALASWRELVIAWKSTKFFVFWGNTTDQTGGTVFNYRPVDAGVGAVGRKAVAVAPEAVYFVDRKGLYRTAGGHPELVSKAIDPIFRGGANGFFGSDELNHGALDQVSLCYHDNRMYLSYPSGASTTCDRVLVYDPRYDYWLLWSIPAVAMSSFRIGNQAELVFAYASGSNHIGRHSSSYTTDDGSSITSRYRTGFVDFRRAGQEKDIARTRMWGTGTVAVAGSRDFGSLDTASNVTLGTSPAIAAGLHNKQKKGEVVSYQFAGVSGGAWALHRYAHYLRGVLPPGERSD